MILEVFHGKFQSATNGLHRVVDLMGQTGCETPDGGEASGLERQSMDMFPLLKEIDCVRVQARVSHSDRHHIRSGAQQGHLGRLEAATNFVHQHQDTNRITPVDHRKQHEILDVFPEDLSNRIVHEGVIVRIVHHGGLALSHHLTEQALIQGNRNLILTLDITPQAGDWL